MRSTPVGAEVVTTGDTETTFEVNLFRPMKYLQCQCLLCQCFFNIVICAVYSYNIYLIFCCMYLEVVAEKGT